VGQFKIVRELKIVNCTTERKRSPIYLKEPPPKKREEAAWADIDKAFSKPITTHDDTAAYVPTQVLSEFFKSEGFDGIGYRSSLGNGFNIVLFDIKSAEIINCSLYSVSGVKFKFSEMPGAYRSSKHYQRKNN